MKKIKLKGKVYKKEKLYSQSIDEVANDWGIDSQVFSIKNNLIDLIKNYCLKNSISQRKLASIVPVLSKDRVSKIFSGEVGHMTIDKLVEILSVLDFKLKVSVKSKAA
jgi:predicted XRE-type DNA-binding protein